MLSLSCRNSNTQCHKKNWNNMLCHDSMKGVAQHKEYDGAWLLIMEISEVDENSKINKALLYISITFLSTCINALNG